MKLSVLRYVIKSGSALGHTDLNKHAEKFFRDLLNLTYDLNLVNLNDKDKNAPAIDLGDETEEVSYQVTATATAAKIEDTIEKFLTHKRYEDYKELRVLVITTKLKTRKTFDTKTLFAFDPKKHIVDIDDVLSDIEKCSLPKLKLIHDLVSSELEPITRALAPVGSLFARAERRANTPPKTAERFLKYFDYEPQEFAGELKRIRKLYKSLANLSKASRSFLAVIVDRGGFEQYGKKRVMIPRKELENMLPEGVSRSDAREFFEVLHGAGFADVEDIPPNRLYLDYSLEFGLDFFAAVKEFCKTEEDIKQLLEDGDFTLLD